MTYLPMPGLKATGREFAAAWDRVAHWATLHFPPLLERLNPPASEAAIDTAQAACGVVFPNDLRTLYRRADGDAEGEPCFFFGLQFLPLDRLVEEWRCWERVLTDDPGINDLIGFQTSTPPDAIAERYVDRGRIPFAYDWGGNHLGVDLNPGPAGSVGQIINFGRDESDKFVIAPSLGEFMHWYADNLEEGNVVVPSVGDPSTWDQFVIADPENDHFLDAVRAMGQQGKAARL